MLADSSNSSLEAHDALKILNPRKAKVKSKQTNLGHLESFFDFKPKISQNLVEINLNIRTYSEAQTITVKKKNGKYTTEHWTAKHKRHKKQKNSIFWAYLEVKEFVKYPCTLTFIRYAPKLLDKHDNLPMSMKWICDAICAEITGEHRPGLADNFEGLTIKYDQVKSKQYAVKIIIEF
jgi:hypothetical protein